MVFSVVRHDALKRIGWSNLADRGYDHITPPRRKVWSTYASRSRRESAFRFLPKGRKQDSKTVVGPKG